VKVFEEMKFLSFGSQKRISTKKSTEEIHPSIPQKSPLISLVYKEVVKIPQFSLKINK